jgi:phage terminase large subunit-like protein
MNAPSKQLEGLVLGRQIEHGGHDVLRWNVANAAIDMNPAGDIKPNKAKATERIDGVVALIMALGRAMSAAQHAPSVYESGAI